MKSRYSLTMLILLLGFAGPMRGQEGAPESAPMPIADDGVVDGTEAPDYPDPQLLIKLESGDKVIEVRPSDRAKVGPEGKTVDVTVNVIRRFEVEGVRFDYPGEFVHELEIKDHHVWTLAGQRAVILAFRYPGATNRDEMFKAFHESLAKEYEVDPKASTKTTLEHPGGAIEGLALRATFKEEGSEQPISQELFSFSAAGSVWILALQDAPEPGSKQASPEYTQMRSMLAKSLTFQQ